MYLVLYADIDGEFRNDHQWPACFDTVDDAIQASRQVVGRWSHAVRVQTEEGEVVWETPTYTDKIASSLEAHA